MVTSIYKMDIVQNDYDQCLYYASNVFARSMEKLAEEEFGAIGLSPSYAYLLMAAIQKPGIRPLELSQILQLHPSTITRLVDKLQIKGYLERLNSGRTTKILPTSKSQGMQLKLARAWQNLQNRYTLLLGEEQTQQLITAIGGARDKIV